MMTGKVIVVGDTTIGDEVVSGFFVEVPRNKLDGRILYKNVFFYQRDDGLLKMKESAEEKKP